MTAIIENVKRHWMVIPDYFDSAENDRPVNMHLVVTSGLVQCFGRELIVTGDHLEFVDFVLRQVVGTFKGVRTLPVMEVIPVYFDDDSDLRVVAAPLCHTQTINSRWPLLASGRYFQLVWSGPDGHFPFSLASSVQEWSPQDMLCSAEQISFLASGSVPLHKYARN